MCVLWPWLRRPWVNVLSCFWVTDNNRVNYYPTWQLVVMAQIRISGTYVLWPWPWRHYLQSRPWHTLGSWTSIVWNIRSTMAVRSYGPDTYFGYVCTVTLALEIWPLVKVMTHPWVMDNNCVKYYPDPTLHFGVMALTQVCVHSDLDLGDITLVKVMSYFWIIENNCVKYNNDPTWQ